MLEPVAQPKPEREHEARWRATLQLGFERVGARTELMRSGHRGPLRVQRPFYPEPAGGSCHVYLLHPPGGVVGGDVLELTAHVGRQAQALITTPGAGKWYRSPGPESRIVQQLSVAEGACLEHFPQENIAYAGARSQVVTRVSLADDSARFANWDILCLGRPACDEPFDRGQVRQRLEVSRAGRLVFWDRSVYTAGAELMGASFGLRNLPVVGTFLCTPAPPSCVDVVRQSLGPRDDLGVTWLNHLLLARYLGPSTQTAHRLFEQIWHIVRPMYAGRSALRPRIWNT